MTCKWNVSYQLWWLVKSRLAWQAPISATISQQLFPGWNEEHILFFSLYFYLSLCLCFPGLVFVSASFCVSRFYFCLFLFFLCWLFVIVLVFISNLSFMQFSAFLHRYCSYFSCCYFLKIYYCAVCIFCPSFCPTAHHYIFLLLSQKLYRCLFLSSVCFSLH